MARMTYEEWCEYKQLVMGEPPAWFHDPEERARRFQSYHDAFEGNCIEANPLDAHFFPETTLQSDAAIAATIPVATIAPTSVQPHAFARHAWVIAAAIVLNLMVMAGAAFAGDGGVIVNGKTLTVQERTSLEAIVGPLAAGRYWARKNGDFGRDGSSAPTVNLRHLVLQRIEAARLQRQRQLQQQQMMARAIQNAMRQRQAMQRSQNGYTYGNRFSSGQRYNNGSWSHYNGHSNYGVGGTANGCIYTPNWSNC